MAKALIFDSSTIITLALNNLLYIFAPLKKKFNGHFFITSSVKKEIVDRPMKMKRFELEALSILKLIKDEVFEIIDPPQQETVQLCNIANNTFKARGEFMQIMHEGEASCLALYKALKKQNYKVALVIDERTTRMLCENPLNLLSLFEKKLHIEVIAKQSNFEEFRRVDIIRSAELCFIAYKKGIISLPTSTNEAISALLFASKFKGCSISYEEIDRAISLI